VSGGFALPPDGWAICLVFTLGIMGGAAWLAGQALAQNWKPAWQMAAYGLLLAAADRFLVFALFGGALLSLPGFIFDAALIEACGLVGWRMTQAARMVAQYPWLYERAGPFAWRSR
jgi:hypothetical protein